MKNPNTNINASTHRTNCDNSNGQNQLNNIHKQYERTYQENIKQTNTHTTWEINQRTPTTKLTTTHEQRCRTTQSTSQHNNNNRQTKRKRTKTK
jgi:hypothetical protein